MLGLKTYRGTIMFQTDINSLVVLGDLGHSFGHDDMQIVRGLSNKG